jgi:hypothetical protein
LYLLSHSEKILIFMALVFGGVIGQFLIVHYIENKIRDSNTILIRYLDKLHTIFRIFQYSLAFLLVFISIQMLFANEYYTILPIAIITFSYSLMAVLLGILASRFVSWLRFYRNAVGISYAITTIVLIVNAIITVVYLDVLLLTKPATTGPYIGGSSYIVSIGIQFDFANMVISIASFSLTWISTAILLYHYSRKFGKVKYWAIIASPLIYFLSQFLTFVPTPLDMLVTEEPVLYSTILTLLFTSTKIIGGIFFGIAFWLISKNLPSGSIIKDYMKICTYGFIFFYISSQSLELVIAPYPPFGLISTAFVGLSSYLILIGIYSSALSASHDIKLRQSIRNLAKNESKLLDSIGRGANDKEIQNKVTKLTRVHREEVLSQTGIPSTLSEEDAKEYLTEVLKELKSRNLSK